MYYFQNPLPNLNKIAQETQRDATFKVITYYHYFKYLLMAYLFLSLIILIIFLIIFIKGKNKVFHQFWYNQPIYHKTIINSDYLFPWLRKPYVIEPNPPELNTILSPLAFMEKSSIRNTPDDFTLCAILELCISFNKAFTSRSESSIEPRVFK